MSINPVLTQDLHTQQLIPHCRNGEYLLMYVSDTHITITVENSRLKGKGDVFLSTHRVVFIKKKDKKFSEGFSSVSLPYTHIDNPRFRQPLFGSNYLEGIIRPVTEDPVPLSADGTFYLYINERCTFLLKEFFTYYARTRNNPGFTVNAHPFSQSPEARSAFVDPNDPTHVYLAQPAAANPNGTESTNTTGEGEPVNQEETSRLNLRNTSAGQHAAGTTAAAMPFYF